MTVWTTWTTWVLTLTRCARVAGLGLCILFVLAGCSSHYVVPGSGANMGVFTGNPQQIVGHDTPTVPMESAPTSPDAEIQKNFDTKPMAKFPAHVATVRVQSPGYRSYSLHHAYGRGAYTVVTQREVEKDEHFQRILNLDGIAGLAAIGRMLLSEDLTSDMQLRLAASKLHADLVLIYTLDTAFWRENEMSPLSIITLGLFPDEHARVITTASAILMDTRSGYIYGVAESTAEDRQLANAWTSQAAIDQVRRRVEAESFDDLVSELEKLWPSIYTRYGLTR